MPLAVTRGRERVRRISAVSCLSGSGRSADGWAAGRSYLLGACSCPMPRRRRRRRCGHHRHDVGRGVEDGGLLGRLRQQAQAVLAGRRGRRPEHLAVGQAQERRRGGDDHAHPLGLQGHALGSRRTSSSIRRVCSRALSVRGLLLHRRGGERRLLHRGVEHQQPDHPGQQHERHQRHERQRAGAGAGPRHDRQPGPLEGGAGESGDPAGAAAGTDPAGPDLEGGAAHLLCDSSVQGKG